MRSLGDIFDELRRRRMFRTAGLYIVGAWIVVQVADLAFPGLQIPDEAIRYVWLGAIAGLPIALIVGWRLDFSAGRLVRTSPRAGGDPETLGQKDHALLAVMAVIVIAITFQLVAAILATRSPQSVPNIAVELDPKSIAVLPFENLSRDAANEPFALGVHDDLLTHISKISDIKVISRTSVARLDPTMSIPDIGRLLGVATVLEGGVQRIGNRVRINAQLIDSMSDQHLWAETFDRELTASGIFAIQTEIATAIAERLRVTLSRRDKTSLEKIPTRNLKAYEAYLLGKQRLTTRTRNELVQAAEYFEAAIALDPEYSLAYVGLADANLLLHDYGYMSLEEMLSKVEPALEVAFEIDGNLGAAFASRGLIGTIQRDYADAETAFRRAIELDPNYAPAYHWLGNLMLNGLANPEGAVPLLDKARLLDPLSPIIIITLGEALEAIGRFDDAMALYRKAVEIEPNFPSSYALIGSQYHTRHGRLDEAARWYRQTITRAPAWSWILSALYLDLGDDVTAEFWAEWGLQQFPNQYLPNLAKLFLHRYRGEQDQALALARRMNELVPGNNAYLVTLVTYGQYQEALDVVAPAYPELDCQNSVTVNRNNVSQAINLSLALEQTGQPDCAQTLLNAVLGAFELMPRFGSRGFGIADVEVYARQGKTDKALRILQQALDEGYRFMWRFQSTGSPHMKSLLDNLQFKAMMAEVETDMAAQLARLREMEASGELAPVPQLD